MQDEAPKGGRGHLQTNPGHRRSNAQQTINTFSLDRILSIYFQFKTTKMSASNSDSFARKRAAIGCDILTRLNFEVWFTTMEAYLQAESLWFIVESAELAFLKRTP